VRGESEKFLFYDGSTNVPPPIVASWTGSGRKTLRLSIRAWGEYPTNEWLPWIERPERERSPLSPIRYAFVIRKDPDAAPRGTVRCGLSPEANPEVVDVEELGLQGDRLSEVFDNALRAEGLSPEEARSLLRTWESDFFQKPGIRLVTFLPRWLYDVAVPLSIYPAPTRVVRVALVLREIQ
jgi:hypothetical protein